MERVTIDFGIDLGTTNSSVSVLQGTGTEVIKNNRNSEITPSCVSISSSGAFRVGAPAFNEYLDSRAGENVFIEFKADMGSGREFVFERNGHRSKAYDLSAEVLRSLRGDVLQQMREDIDAAVITVPAAFELDQCEATKKAAELAGFKHSILLQEPVAAAMAYGFQTQSDDAFWLVYDLGGGTFDAAVMQVKEGLIRVVNNEGDNQLGGKLIDWAIVDHLLVPFLVRKFGLSDFHRGNRKWKSAFRRLKYYAEQAKISLSRSVCEPIEEAIEIPHTGQRLEFSYELKRADVERLSEPFIVRSLNVCKKALSSKNLQVGNIEKIILVGGATKMPYLRERLADPHDGLGLPLCFDLDPLTVVSRGAAVFAGTQLLELTNTTPSLGIGQYLIELDYKPVGADPEPLIGGKVTSPNGLLLSNISVEFVNTATRWRSGKLRLRPDGGFIAKLNAEKGGSNTFAIELRDESGTALVSIPSKITYTIGLAITDPPLIHSIGIADVNNQRMCLLSKEAPLPVRKLYVHHQAFHVHRGRADERIRIPVISGEHPRADRNQVIGYLEVSGEQLKRDVPAGSEIEITVEVDQSRLLRTRAYIPVVDLELELIQNLERSVPEMEELRRDVEREKERLADLRRKVDEVQEGAAIQRLERLEEEGIEDDIDHSLIAATNDPGERNRCHKTLLGLRVANDEVEDAILLPGLLSEARQLIGWTDEVVNTLGNDDDARAFHRLRRDLELAMESKPFDPDMLRRKIDELYSFRFGVLSRDPGWWIGYLDYLAGQKNSMTDIAQADLLIAQGQRSINGDDLEGLKSACKQLLNLLPPDQQDKARGLGSTVVGH